MKHHLVTLVILLLAVLAYAAGLGPGGAGLLIVGGGLEVWFLVRTTRQLRSPSRRR